WGRRQAWPAHGPRVRVRGRLAGYTPAEKGTRHEDRTHEHLRRRLGQGAELLHGRARLPEEGRRQQRTLPLAYRGVSGRPGRNPVAPRGQCRRGREGFPGGEVLPE